MVTTGERGGIWKERRICLYLIGNTRRMILNIIQRLFRRLGVGAHHRSRGGEMGWRRVNGSE